MTPENEKTVAEQMVEGAQNTGSVAEKMAAGTQKDLTGRALNEPRLQSDGNADKPKGDARTAEAPDAAHRATEQAGRAANRNQPDKP
jgi:hypothetical protein